MTSSAARVSQDIQFVQISENTKSDEVMLIKCKIYIKASSVTWARVGKIIKDEIHSISIKHKQEALCG